MTTSIRVGQHLGRGQAIRAKTSAMVGMTIAGEYNVEKFTVYGIKPPNVPNLKLT